MKKNYIAPLVKQIIIEEENIICDSPTDPLSLKVDKTEKADDTDDLANERYSIEDADDIGFDDLW